MTTHIASGNTTGTYANTGLNSVSDWWISEGDPTGNNEFSNQIEVVAFAEGDRAHGFLKVDNLSSIGVGSVINSQMGFWVNFADGGANVHEARQALRAVNESGCTWEEYSAGNDWQVPGGTGSLDIASAQLATATSTGGTGYWLIFSGSALNTAISQACAGVISSLLSYLGLVDDLGNNGRYEVFSGTSGDNGQRPWVKFDHTPGASGIEASSNITFAALTASANGSLSISGSFNKTLAALTSASSVSLSISGSANKTLSALTASGSASLNVSGNLNKTLAALTSTSAASIRIQGSSNITLAPLTASGTGSLSVAGSVNKTLAPLTSTASASSSISGTAGITLAPLTVIGVANLADGTISAFLNKTLAALTTTSAAIVQNNTAEATLNKTLEALTSSSNASLSVTGAGLITLAPLVSSAQVQVNINGALTFTLQPLTSNGAIGELITWDGIPEVNNLWLLNRRQLKLSPVRTGLNLYKIN